MTADKQEDLRTAFDLNGGTASAYVIMLVAASAPSLLERDGWIERAPNVARWDDTYKPGPKLLEAST